MKSYFYVESKTVKFRDREVERWLLEVVGQEDMGRCCPRIQVSVIPTEGDSEKSNV